MQVESPDASSTKSSNASKGSRAAASQAAREAFQNKSTLSLDGKQTAVPADQHGRRRLNDSYWIKRDCIVPDPEQPRKKFNAGEMAELAASIRSRGIKQPLTVRWDVDRHRYMIIDGGRRFQAATKLGIDELPCWVQPGSASEVLVDQIVQNWQRSNLRPYETADALARLRDEFGLNGKEIAELTGKSKGEISEFLLIHDRIEPKVEEMARSEEGDRLSRRHLFTISKLSANEQVALAEEVVREKLTVQQTGQRVSKPHAKSTRTTLRKPRGLSARQRRYSTEQADVVITFRKAKFSDEDIITVLDAVRTQL